MHIHDPHSRPTASAPRKNGVRTLRSSRASTEKGGFLSAFAAGAKLKTVPGQVQNTQPSTSRTRAPHCVSSGTASRARPRLRLNSRPVDTRRREHPCGAAHKAHQKARRGARIRKDRGDSAHGESTRENHGSECKGDLPTRLRDHRRECARLAWPQPSNTSSSFSEESWPCFNAQDSSSCVTLPGRLAEHVEESIHELVDLERCPEAEHLSASGHSGVREGHHEPHV